MVGYGYGISSIYIRLLLLGSRLLANMGDSIVIIPERESCIRHGFGNRRNDKR